MITWLELESIDDTMEKLVFPLEQDDCYDRGKINEFNSQIYLFQGSLSHLNSFIYDYNRDKNEDQPKLAIPKMLIDSPWSDHVQTLK